MRGITCKNKEGLKVLTEASFTAYSGEILGVAGISGSGQKELLESVAGLQPIESGEILYFSPEGTTEKISEMKAEDIKNLGITLSFVPEDRLGMGLVGSMDLTDNMMIRSYKEGRHFFADRKSPKKLAEDIVEKLDVVTPGVDKPIMLILAISSITVCLMCPTMSFFATLLFKSAGKEFIAVWFQTTALNFPMAFFWQIFFAGPLVELFSE